MTGKELEHQLIKRYLADECTSEEILEVHKWIAANENEEALKSLIDDLLNHKNGGIEITPNRDKELLWQSIEQDINRKHFAVNKPAPENQLKTVNPFFTFSKITASIALLLGVFTVLYFYNNEEKIEQPIAKVFSEISTISGQKKNITLPDGTRVILNSSSSISFEKEFLKSNERRITLKGEAYFDVTKNKTKPFIVSTNSVETKVLGTSFNVKLDSNKVYIALVEGRVEMKNQDNIIELTPEEMGIADMLDSSLYKTYFDIQEITGWKDGKLVLKDANYNEVMQRLQEWYGVEFEQKGKTPTGTINTIYDNVSLSEVLLGLSFTYNFDYTINKDQVNIILK
ncbi:FecR family protein [Chondrinema litorale]|uniref:FecR family protein n=1 Tax=Chondrinema litorale TaxID=2994555 RepID=UPI0025433971|nr:FecR family protein [Chondrinema litorale]UZR97393.1 FecR family protein [Chondrinema litorale]